MKQSAATSTLIRNALDHAFSNLTEKFRNALETAYVYNNNYDDYDEELKEISASYHRSLRNNGNHENCRNIDEARKAMMAKVLHDCEGDSRDYEFRHHIEWAISEAVFAASEAFGQYFSDKLDRFTDELMSYVEELKMEVTNNEAVL